MIPLLYILKFYMAKKKKTIPFDFVIEALDELDPYLKPMFGAHGVYVDNKIVFILRDRPTSPADNGIWLATTGEHHKSLQKNFPSMRSIEMFGPGPTGWQVLPADAEDFEEAAFKACELVIKNDPRIGKIPKAKIKKPKKTSARSSKPSATKRSK